MQVLQELASDKALERFRIEYEKLYKALKKSHGNPVLVEVAPTQHVMLRDLQQQHREPSRNNSQLHWWEQDPRFGRSP